MTPEQVSQLLDELALQESTCRRPDPDADDTETAEWPEVRGAGRAYAHAQTIVRRIVGSAA